jgi:hypothetical protein
VLGSGNETMDSETGQAFERLSRELRDGLQEVRTELRTELRDGLQEVGTELRNEIQEVRRHADVVAESLRGEIRLVAEGVVGLDEKFTLEFANVREELREQIGGVLTLLRVSYADLDRRIKPS